MKRVILVAFLSSLGATLAADEVLLKSGGRLSGQIVSDDGRTVVIEVGPGRVSIPAASVARIERGQTPLSVYRERAGRLRADDASGWLELAFWAQERDLLTQAHEAFERVLRIDPGDPAANAALGRVQHEGRWMSADESYRARGYVRYEGEWVTPAEQEARLRAKVAEAQAGAAEREGEARAREAEARARQAEAEAREAEAYAQDPVYEGVPLWWGWGGTGVVLPPVLPPPTTLLPPIRPPRPTPVAPPPRPNPRSRPVPQGR
jgi:hypothetical protein